MPCWSAENATKAYLSSLKLGKRGKEPDVGEFISAIAAGNNARLMVIAHSGVASRSYLLALVAAAYQTGGKVVCISDDINDLQECRKSLEPYEQGSCVELVLGNAKDELLYKGADFVLVDCAAKAANEVFLAAINGAKNGALVTGHGALSRGSWWIDAKAQFLPIGRGLLLSKIDPNAKLKITESKERGTRRSRWIVKIDELTGEEHFFRVTCHSGKETEI